MNQLPHHLIVRPPTMADAQAVLNKDILRYGGSRVLTPLCFGLFYRRGQSRIALGVDSQNPNAYQFYEGVGMRRVRQFDEYQKSLKRVDS